MAEIKNPEAYFGTMVRNSYKDEFRSNDNFFKHVDTVGDEIDIRKKMDKARTSDPDVNYVETSICESCIENWLLLMDNQSLHSAICSLKDKDIAFLFALSRYKYNCKEYAIACGLSKQGIARKFGYLKKRIKFLMQKCCPK